MPIKGKPPAEEQQAPLGTFGPAPLVCEKFQGINTSTSRPGVADEQCYWLDGFFPIGNRFLRVLYGIGPKIWTPSPGSITFFDFANIGATPIMVGITSLGGIWQINTTTLVVTRIAADGTILNPTRTNVGMTQWGSQYVIIVASQTNGYWIWDGTTFYSAGGPAPGGSTMPTGIQGQSVETYSGRVWVSNNASITFSAPGSFKDFATGSGGGSFTSSDSFLRVQFTQLRQTNGFLYLIADSSVNYISGVQTSGTPPTTTFTNQNADPEVGTPWPGTVDVFGRNILFANAFGAHVSYGAAVTKISEPLDGVYNTVPNFGGLIPSAAKAIIFGKKVWILLLPIVDPISGQQRNKLFLWNNKTWVATEQDVTLTFIQHQEISSVITAYGTDGISVYPLFAQPSVGFTKTVQSKLWDAPGYWYNKSGVRFWGMAQYFSLTLPNLTVSIDNEIGPATQTVTAGPAVMTWTNLAGATMTWTNASAQTMTWFAAGGAYSIFSPDAVGQWGALLGMTVTTQSPDMALLSIALQPENVQYRG